MTSSVPKATRAGGGRREEEEEEWGKGGGGGASRSVPPLSCLLGVDPGSSCTSSTLDWLTLLLEGPTGAVLGGLRVGLVVRGEIESCGWFD